MQALHINGNDLTLEEVRQVVYERRPVLLQPEARHAVERARAVVDDLVEDQRVAYAVNTGVGQLADLHISPSGHSQVTGQPAALARGRSGRAAGGRRDPRHDAAARQLAGQGLLRRAAGRHRYLCEMLNRGVHPVIPSQGSVGASGDLAPLAHLALVLIAEGEAMHQGKRMTAAEAHEASRHQAR